MEQVRESMCHAVSAVTYKYLRIPGALKKIFKYASIWGNLLCGIPISKTSNNSILMTFSLFFFLNFARDSIYMSSLPKVY